MSEQMPHDDALEQQLRAHYASEFGQPPSPAAIWASLQEELQPSSHAESSSMTIAVRHPAATRPHTDLPSHTLHGRALGAWSTLLHSLLPVAAAVLLIAVFAAVLLGPFGRAYFDHTRGIHTPTPTATSAPATPTPEVPAGYSVHVLTSDETWRGDSLTDLQMLSPDEGWAVGNHRVSSSAFESAILHYSHGRWTASPDVFTNIQPSSISMLSPEEGWIAGGNDAGQAALLHYSGGHWRSAPAPDHGPIVQISMLTPSDGWAVQLVQSAISTPARFALLHYDGTTWSLADTAGMQLTTLSMLSPSDGWAAGDDGVIAHFQNGKWTRWPTKAPGEVTYITMISPTDGWISGVVPNQNIEPDNIKLHHIFMLHYDGSDWRPITFPTLPDLQDVYPNALADYPDGTMPSVLTGISMVSPTEGWASGDLAGRVSALYHYSGGKWRLSPFAVNQSLSKIWMVSAGEGWAIGRSRFIVNGDETAVILHYLHGSWSIYKP